MRWITRAAAICEVCDLSRSEVEAKAARDPHRLRFGGTAPMDHLVSKEFPPRSAAAAAEEAISKSDHRLDNSGVAKRITAGGSEGCLNRYNRERGNLMAQVDSQFMPYGEALEVRRTARAIES